MPKIRVAFIGCGDVSELHHQGLKQCAQAELAGIHDSNAALRKKREEQWNVASFSSLEVLLQDREIDAVFILTPVECHHTHVMASLHAGKHVLVEKPLANEVIHIQEMADLAESKGLQCMPAHNYIYSPDMYRLKKNIASGNLGRIAISWLLYHIHHNEASFSVDKGGFPFRIHSLIK